MEIRELRITLNKLGLSKRKLSKALGYNETYFSSLVSRKEQSTVVPKHIETIIGLLYTLKINNIKYENAIAQKKK